MVIGIILALLVGAVSGYFLRGFIEGPVAEGLRGELEYAHEQLEAYEDKIADLMEKVAKKPRKVKTEVADTVTT